MRCTQPKSLARNPKRKRRKENVYIFGVTTNPQAVPFLDTLSKAVKKNVADIIQIFVVFCFQFVVELGQWWMHNMVYFDPDQGKNITFNCCEQFMMYYKGKLVKKYVKIIAFCT